MTIIAAAATEKHFGMLLNGPDDTTDPTSPPVGTGYPTPPRAGNPVVGSGNTVSPHTLQLILTQDAYQGNAQFSMSLDGVTAGATTVSADALTSSAHAEMFSWSGSITDRAHEIGVTFLNDAWGGSDATDRNVHVMGVIYDNKDYLPSAVNLTNTGSQLLVDVGSSNPTVAATAGLPNHMSVSAAPTTYAFPTT
ncbi:MAG: carbohydrate-binding domain-containing protein [Janthinobacterium lividum]